MLRTAAAVGVLLLENVLGLIASADKDMNAN